MITLNAHQQTLTVDPVGAIITSYTSHGQDVLYPRQQLDGSWRGGCHVCVPNFGPGGDSGQAQHGYGRAVTWQVVEQTADHVQLAHQASSDAGEYAGLALTITYQLQPGGARFTLAAHNQGQQPLRLAPGWHPYFALPDQAHDQQGQFGLDGTTHQAADYTEAVLLPAQPGPRQLQLGKQHYQLDAPDLPIMALWSAHPQRYICVEPTAAGNSFADAASAPAGELLPPGQQRSYVMALTTGAA